MTSTKRELPPGVTTDDFYAYLPEHKYIFVRTRELWPSTSIDRALPRVKKMKASAWLDRNKPLHQMTWAPGHETLIENALIVGGGWIESEGTVCFNQYLPPALGTGDQWKASPWVNHIKKIYPSDHDHIFKFLAHRVQKPWEKINHALMLGGVPGIGKDALLAPVRHAVGPANFHDIAPGDVLADFNPFRKSVVLRISEARDLGDINRFAFYESTKTLAAAPPETLRINEKHIREYLVPNVCGVIITTNYKSDGIYLPADDRRHYVAWSPWTESPYQDDRNFFNRLFEWYETDDLAGYRHINTFLQRFDLSGFDAKSPPPKTQAFWDIVEASSSPQDAELRDAIDALGREKHLNVAAGEAVKAFTIDEIRAHANGHLLPFLNDPKNIRLIASRFEKLNYTPVRDMTTNTTGFWRVANRRQRIYGHSRLSERDRIDAAQKLKAYLDTKHTLSG